MEVKTVAIGDIKENPNNPRHISDAKFKKLVKSIKAFPEMMRLRPIVVNREGVILGGNMRYNAAKSAGLKDIYVMYADELTEAQQREFIIKDNASFGQWDWDMIANEWDADQLDEWGLDLPVFNIDDEDEADPFEDEGIAGENQYGVIVFCKNDTEQEAIYERLSKEGYPCKVVVT